MLFLTDMGHFWPHAKSQKNLIYIYILGEPVHNQTAGQRNDQTTKNRHFTKTPHCRSNKPSRE